MQYLPLLRSLDGSRKVIERRVLFEYGCEYFVPCEAVMLDIVSKIRRWMDMAFSLTYYFVPWSRQPAAV